VEEFGAADARLSESGLPGIKSFAVEVDGKELEPLDPAGLTGASRF
jgi:hypothetical protein